MTHNNTVNDECYKMPEWDHICKVAPSAWKKWHEYWIEKSQTSEVPIYYFRFEDIISDPKSVLTEIFSMVLGVPSLEGTVME
jgi:hypothetical protein